MRLHGVYNYKDDKVIIMWRNFRVMEVNNIRNTYNVAHREKMIKQVINKHRQIAKDIVNDYKGGN